jgi:hypothetical protein
MPDEVGVLIVWKPWLETYSSFPDKYGPKGAVSA